MAPRRAYLETPLLCVAEAKKDDFEQGAAQCIAGMVACRSNNRQANLEMDIYCLVSWTIYATNAPGTSLLDKLDKLDKPDKPDK